MQISAYRTEKIHKGDQLYQVLSTSLPRLTERNIVVITSKIVSLCENAVVPNEGRISKRKLIRRESEYFLEECLSRYGITLTIKNGVLIASAGIDESNGHGYFVLWPRDALQTARQIWSYLKEKYRLKQLGIIICDSHTTPLRWGVTGVGIAWCGFKPLNNYIGTPDIFGRKLHVTKASVLDGLAAAAVVAMGEGNEQTPLAVISDLPFVSFMNRPPNQKEINEIRISLKDDIYAPLIDSPKWRRGGSPE